MKCINYSAMRCNVIFLSHGIFLCEKKLGTNNWPGSSLVFFIPNSKGVVVKGRVVGKDE